jgi:type IV fimbrial biogenesis protein FimT
MVTRGAAGFARLARAAAVRRSRGFTLTELMIVVTVFAILVAAALPSYNEFVRNQRVKTASFEVFSSLVLARSEAITRNAAVTMAPVTAGNWNSGWRVTATGGTVLRNQEALPSSITITGPTNIVYTGSGRLSAAADAPFQLTASGTSVTTRCITIDLSGRPVTKASTC